jgi:hypothetical protein
VVGLEDGLGGGESRAHRLGPTAEAGEEVRLDEAGDDAHVGLDVLALQQDGRAVDPPTSTWSPPSESWSTMA